MATHQQPDFGTVNPQCALNPLRTVPSNVAAKMLDRSIRMIIHLILIGELPAVRKGSRAWQIRVCDIETLKNRREYSIRVRKRPKVNVRPPVYT